MQHNIYDMTFSGLGDGMYRDWVGLAGEKDTRPAVLRNWPEEDLVSFVGGPYIPRNN